MSRDAIWWRVAWRSLWRNRLRTLITASGLAFGFLAAVIMVGLTDGMVTELVNNGTRLIIGQAQVHADDFLPERSMHRTIGGYDGTDVEALIARMESNPNVAAVAPRVYGGGLLSSGDETQAGLLMGIDPRREPEVTTLLLNGSAGRPPVAGVNEILVGAAMADQLGLELGAEVVVVAPAVDGSMGNDLFTLVGTFETGTPALDANYAILALPALQLLMALDEERIHEVAVAFVQASETALSSASLAETLSDGPPVRVSPWTELRPELAEMIALMDGANFLIVVIIFAMAIFGVANTMSLGTFERRHEFALVRALGTTPLGVWRTVVYEGIILGLMSLLGGALITWPILVWWHNFPPDLTSLISGFSMSGSQWRPILRVEYSLMAPLVSVIALFLTSILAALYPAWKATRIPPADALADR